MARQILRARAPAKVNLTLRVLGKRADGYHELQSLVAFAGVGDRLTLAPGPDLALTVVGATAGQAGPDADNLVLAAARNLKAQLPNVQLGRFALSKQLPVAAGLGGGSSDAAAALRLLARANDLPLTHPALLDAAVASGADVPVCLTGQARMMAGTGALLGPALAMPPVLALLVNPRTPVATPGVFRALDAGPAPEQAAPLIPDVATHEALRALVRAGVNDLEAPALTLCPEIGVALGLLGQQEGCWLARMSGSGASCFALFDDRRAVVKAAAAVRAAQPGWWVRATVFRSF